MKTAMKTLAKLAVLGLLTACGGSQQSEANKQLKAAEKAATDAIANTPEAAKEAAAKAAEKVRQDGEAAKLRSDQIDDAANQAAEAARQAVKAQGK